MAQYFDKGPNLLFSGICQLICFNFYNWYYVTNIIALLLNSPLRQNFNSIELAIFREVFIVSKTHVANTSSYHEIWIHGI